MREGFAKMDADIVRLLCLWNGESYAGIVSAGDIQRAIIANQPLETPMSEILRKDVRVAHQGDSFEVINDLMLQHRTEFMPVLNDAGDLVDVHFWDDLFQTGKPEGEKIDLPVVIMAGGKGTRLKPFSNVLPKPLFPLGEKTIIETIMDRFQNVGCRRFLFSVNYRHEFIRTYFESITDKSYAIHYFMEDRPLGTAGSLRLVKDRIKETFFVSNCDIIIDADYADIYRYHQEEKNEITMVVSLKHIKIPYGTVETEEGGQVTSLVEKPELTYMVNAGLYILEPHLLDEIKEDTFFHITELIDLVKKRGGRVGAFPVSEKSWCDIGEWAEYRETLGALGLT
ncbi:nucleotidyltransferase family protein [Akkermansiaceae bacterium]|nr:nucleotidyltransferase family protein [Akkermansiaceae bacterium]MDB4670065.1 nucleotidyltransferase family protein [Akkermansiaceae bacterium]